MIHTKIVEKEIVTTLNKRMEVDGVECDICREVFDAEFSTYDFETIWNDNCYEETVSTVLLKEGDVYPEGDNRDIYAFQICPKCFKEKLVPFIESFGSKTTTENPIKTIWS